MNRCGYCQHKKVTWVPQWYHPGEATRSQNLCHWYHPKASPCVLPKNPVCIINLT